MDKVGPICRNAEDCAIVLNVISGTDGKDQSAIELPFNYSPEVNIKKIKIGFFKSDFDKDTLNKSFNNSAMDQ